MYLDKIIETKLKLTFSKKCIQLMFVPITHVGESFIKKTLLM